MKYSARPANKSAKYANFIQIFFSWNFSLKKSDDKETIGGDQCFSLNEHITHGHVSAAAVWETNKNNLYWFNPKKQSHYKKFKNRFHRKYRKQFNKWKQIKCKDRIISLCSSKYQRRICKQQNLSWINYVQRFTHLYTSAICHAI